MKTQPTLQKSVMLILLMAVFYSCRSDSNKTNNNPKLVLKEALYKHYPKEGDQNNLQALDAVEGLISFDSTNGELYFIRGYCLSKLSYNGKANESFWKAIKLGFDEKKCLNDIFLNSMQSGNLDEAQKSLKKLSRIDPDYEKISNFKRYLDIKIKYTQSK